jgi:hypothetical protein
MSYKLPFILFIFIVLTVACKKSDNGRHNLLLESGFEGSSPYLGWANDQHCCGYSLKQSPAKFTEGSNSLRLEVDSLDPQTSSSIRSELVQEAEKAGTERWYGFNMYLENWTDDNAGESVFQWHPDNSTGTATASLWASGGRFVFQSNSSGGNAGSEYIDLGPVLSNQWVSWVIHVKWATDNSGIMQVWKNGALVIDKPHAVTAPPEGTYFKLGINKFGWGIQSSSVAQRVLYFDEVRIGNERAKYEDVKPGL